MTMLATTTRFALVGLVCAATHVAVVLVADRWHIHYAVACLLSYLVVVALGFALHVRFTFRQRPGFDQFWRYGLGMAANYPMTLALLFVMCDVAGWPVAIATPTATVLMMAWNFIASRWAIIRQPIDASASSRRS